MGTPFIPGKRYRISESVEAHVYGHYTEGGNVRLFGLRVHAYESGHISQTHTSWCGDGKWSSRSYVYKSDDWDIASTEPLGDIPDYRMVVDVDDRSARVIAEAVTAALTESAA